MDASYSVLHSSTDKNESLLENEEDNVPVELSSANTATWFSCFVCLTNTLMGAGMLGLPYAFANTGWILGTFLMACCACSSAFALHVLSICATKTEKPSSFYAVAMLAAPSYVVLIDFAVAIKCFGVATSYLIIIGGLMPEAMEQLGADGSWQKRQLWVAIGFAIVAPIACLNSLENLKFTSSFSLFFVTFVTVLIVLFAFNDIPGLDACANVAEGDLCIGEKTLWNPSTFSVLRVLSIFVFGFTCHQNTFPVVNELKNPTQDRVNAVLFPSIGVAFGLYCLVAMSGYSTYGDEVESNILQNYPRIPVTTIARIFISILVCFTYPLQCNPSRRSILNMMRFASGGKHPSSAVYRMRYIGITLCFLGASFLIALTVSDLSVMLSLVGATGSTIVSYILPGGCYYILHQHEGPVWKRYAALLQFCVGLVIIPVCLTFIFI